MGAGGTKNVQNWVTSYMNDPKSIIIACMEVQNGCHSIALMSSRFLIRFFPGGNPIEDISLKTD